MNCKDADRMIPLFLDDELDNQGLSDFLNHIDKCPECKEELTIQFLVKVGMQRLEDGNNFNLKNELDGILGKARKKLRFRRYISFSGLMLELLVLALLVVTVVLAFSLGI
ncbi:MAG: zf-HC2 domain-containing protein [Butyrivibrio sp.]|nr:zf-HC2 domain-containing protein [Butyrivibrio sp.]